MVTIVGQDAAGNHQGVPISPIAPKGEVPKPWEGPYFKMQQETIRGSLFPLLPLRVKCQNHERVPISPISPILTLRGNRGNRDPISVLKETRYVCRYVLTFFGHWLVHASDVMIAMDENMYD